MKYQCETYLNYQYPPHFPVRLPYYNVYSLFFGLVLLPIGLFSVISTIFYDSMVHTLLSQMSLYRNGLLSLFIENLNLECNYHYNMIGMGGDK